jgi:DNA-binding transcriptional regulator YdaS (Cro superfamily)
MKSKAHAKTPLEIAIDCFESKAELARRLNVKPCYISKMLREKHVPVEQCRAIERATDGKVKAEELRPDIFKAA